jgi:hypothetical protein
LICSFFGILLLKIIQPIIPQGSFFIFEEKVEESERDKPIFPD